jgi:hypothetical protein
MPVESPRVADLSALELVATLARAMEPLRLKTYSPAEIAVVTGISREKVMEDLERFKVPPAERPGDQRGRWRYRWAAIERLLEEKERESERELGWDRWKG